MPAASPRERAPSYKPLIIKVYPIKDFTGGLNLRADAFQLKEGESPDLLNVDIDPRGGFSMRKGVGTLNSTALSNLPKNIWEFSTSGATYQVIVQDGNDAAYSTGGNFTAINPDALTMTGKMRAATFNDINYIQRNAEQVAFKWDGATATVLGTTFNENLAAPDNGDMPKAKCIAAHRGYLWVANTVEAGTAYKNRVRWSHPNKPEDWRTNDYIDIDVGVDGDEVVGLVPFGDKLLVFKQNSVHAINGFSPETFAAVTVSHEVGAISQEAIATSPGSCYFFSWPDGVMHYDGQKVTWEFERLATLIIGGGTGLTIPTAYITGITLGWLNRRLWVSVPYGSSTINSRVYVLDPAVGAPKGAWVAYDLKLGPFLEWQPPNTAATLLAVSSDSANKRVFKLEQGTTNDIFDGSTVVQIATYYYTRWLDPTTPSQRKRWRRPDFIMDGDTAVTLQVDVWKDFDPTLIRRTFFLTPTIAVASNSLTWDVGNWDEKNWASDAVTGSQQILRGLGIGTARAIQLKVTGPATSVAWGVNAISFKYLPKRVR